MTETYAFPPWLEAHAIPDQRMALAYEAVDGRERAAIKETIALLHALWGERPCRSERERFFPSFAARDQEKPADYALFLVEGNYPRPTAFLAAVMPAVLAGVERIIPCFFPAGKGLPGPGLLAALELAGVERAFTLTVRDFPALARDMEENFGDGRLVCLSQDHTGQDDAGQALAGLAAGPLARGTACMNLPGPAAALSRPPGFNACARNGGRFGQPPLLTLDSAHEQVWIWPQLGPSWFRTKRIHISSHRVR